MLERAGLNPYVLEMANLREQCSWVHQKEPGAATAKAVDLVRMAVARASRLEPLQSRKIPLAKLGIRPERLRLEWVSAAEGIRFAALMQEMETLRMGVTSEEIGQTVRALAEKAAKTAPAV